MHGRLDVAIEHILLYYKRRISPRKGFRCAHDVLHKQGSCSTWALEETKRSGAINMFQGISKRLLSCRSAYKSLSVQNREKTETDRPSSECAKQDVVACCINIFPAK
ncbi:MAG: membrane protein insertion efficiency factor YidD [Candidatus Thiodiazotropha sp. (ex Semelilucina semeliformis)]|nr:membrane protein insertion efficiency factor YidD [Candidatus Thiodiazotropha sp. (ex Semelilucina semeliformis)]